MVRLNQILPPLQSARRKQILAGAPHGLMADSHYWRPSADIILDWLGRQESREPRRVRVSSRGGERRDVPFQACDAARKTGEPRRRAVPS